MNVIILGSGMMGRAIAYDLEKCSSFSKITILDKDKNSLSSAKDFLKSNIIDFQIRDVENVQKIEEILRSTNVVVSTIPYFYNLELMKLSIKHNAHFIDLGGNNNVVSKQKNYHKKAVDANVTIILDNGLAPGLVSVITKDIVDHYENIEDVRIRVGGVPIHPKPPLDYEHVFSLNGLINEYMEDALILDHGEIKPKPSMTEIELISFPKPFGMMEAFITSGGCSRLPYTFRDKIGYLDYKTIRYPGHCKKFKAILDLGFGSTTPQSIDGFDVVPRDVLIHQLNQVLPKTGEDAVLLKVISHAMKNHSQYLIEYTMIDYGDKEKSLTAMMRTTGFPVSITATFLLDKLIKTCGVFCPEEIIPPLQFFSELEKRNITIEKTETKTEDKKVEMDE